MKQTTQTLRMLFAFVLAICMVLSMASVACADSTADLYIRSVEDVPDGGEYDTVYIEAGVGDAEIRLTGLTCKKLVVLGGESVTMAPDCTVEDISIQHKGNAMVLNVESGAVVSSLVIESAENTVTICGRISSLELKGDNITASITAGTVDTASVTGVRSILIVDEGTVTGACKLEEEAEESQIIIRGSVVSATAAADNSAITVEQSGSVAVISTGENTCGAEVNVSGVVGHVVVYENTSDVKISIDSTGAVTAIGAETDVQINMDSGARLDNLVTSENAAVTGNVEAGNSQVREDVISDGLVNLKGPAAPAAPSQPETPATPSRPEAPAEAEEPMGPPPEWAKASSGREYFDDLQPALDAQGNVTMLADQYYGKYQALDYALQSGTKLPVTEENKDSVRVDMWRFWGMKNMVNQDGDSCPQYLPVDDETLYRDTAVPEDDPEAWVSAKYLYETYSSSKLLVDLSSEKVTVNKYDHQNAVAQTSQAIDMNGCTLYKTNGSGNGLCLGEDDSATEQTFCVENGSFVGQNMSYDPDTETWENPGSLSANNCVLQLSNENSFIIKDCTFTGGYVNLRNGDADGYMEVVFDGCSFETTDIRVNTNKSTQLNMNFNGCSFIIGTEGEITLPTTVWGDVNFSNCDFTVTKSLTTAYYSQDKAIQVRAYSDSNGNHDLSITFEESTLNGGAIDVAGAKKLVYNQFNDMNDPSSNVTTVFVDTDGVSVGEDSQKAMEHDSNQTVDQADIAPESAAANAIKIETAAEEVLGVEIVGSAPAAASSETDCSTPGGDVE